MFTTRAPYTRAVSAATELGQIGLNRDKYGTFLNQSSVHFGSPKKLGSYFFPELKIKQPNLLFLVKVFSSFATRLNFFTLRS